MTEYSDEVISLAGAQMYGYSRSAGPSVASMAGQGSWTAKAISHCIQLSGSRSTRAALSPRTTTAVPTAVPEVSCVIDISPCCHLVVTGVAESGKGCASAVLSGT